MYRRGFINGVVVLAIAIVAGFLAREIGDAEWAENVTGLTVIVAWVFAGYLYKKRIGPMFLLDDGKAVQKLLQFAIGAGLVWGPVKLYLSGFPVHGVAPKVNVILALAAIPLAGMGVIGALAIGGLFYRDSKGSDSIEN